MNKSIDFDVFKRQLGMTDFKGERHYDTIYRTPEEESCDEPLSVSDIRENVKNECKIQIGEQDLQYSHRFEQIKEQVEQEIESKREAELSRERKNKLMQVEQIHTEKALKLLEEETEQDIENAKSRENEAKLKIIIIQKELKQKVEFFNYMKEKHLRNEEAFSIISCVRKEYCQQWLFYYLGCKLNQRIEEREAEYEIERVKQLEKQAHRAYDIYTYNQQKKLFVLMKELSAYLRTERFMKQDQNKRREKIEAFVERLEEPEQPAVDSMKDNKEEGIPPREQHEAELEAEQPANEEAVEPAAEYSKAKEYKPYVPPPKPRFLIIEEEKRLEKEKELLEKKKQRETEEKEEEARNKQNEILAQKHYKTNCLIKLAFYSVIKKYKQLYEQELEYVCWVSNEVEERAFLTIKQEYFFEQEKSAKLFDTLFPVISRIYREVELKKAFKRFKFNLQVSKLENKLAQEQNNTILRRGGIYSLLNRYSCVLSEQVVRGEKLRETVLKKEIIFKLKENIRFSKFDQEVEEEISESMAKLEFNELPLEEILSKNFQSFWNSNCPKCPAFADIIPDEKKFYSLCKLAQLHEE